MSVSAYYDTWCDGLGCLKWCEDGTGHTAREARRNAKAHGWKHKRDGRDLCPSCAAKESEEERTDG